MPTERRRPGSAAVPSIGATWGTSYQTCFTAEPDAIRRALKAALARFAGHLAARDAGVLELSLAEVLNNSAEHGYDSRPPGPVRICLRLAGNSITCRVEDIGHPMPNEDLPTGTIPTVAENVANLAEGGWGWALIRTLSEDVVYSRHGARNQLMFRVPLTGK